MKSSMMQYYLQQYFRLRAYKLSRIILFSGRVYNVTQYMDFHPGGVEELMLGVGKDATNVFNQVYMTILLLEFIKREVENNIYFLILSL
jgi:cytochrome b involved in lipid metabolism